MSVEAIAWALRQRAGDPRAKVILLCLANYADERGQCWPSQATLAEQSEQSVDTVQRRLRELEARGLIRRDRRTREDGGWSSDQVTLMMFQPSLPLPQPAAGGTAASGRDPTATGEGGYRTAAVGPTALRRHHESVTEPKDETVLERGRTREQIDRIRDRLIEAGGTALDPTSTSLMILSEPLRWLDAGCDLEADIVPVIQARAATVRRQVRAWGFFTAAVFEARDRRLEPEPGPAGAKPRASPPTRESYASIALELEQRFGRQDPDHH